MPPFMLLFLVFLLAPALCSARHVININPHIININNSAVKFELSSLEWEPIARYFLAGSTSGPNVYVIPESGMVKDFLSESSSNNSGVSVNAVAIDHKRQRLIVVFSNHSSVAAYDLKSHGRVFTVPLPELDGTASGVAVDAESGDMFVSSANRGVVLKVGSEGERRKVISEFVISDDEGLGGLVYTSHGYIVTVQSATGRMFTVDSSNEEVKEVSYSQSIKPFASAGQAITLQSNRSIVVATNKKVISLTSDSTNWEQMALHDEVKLGRHGRIVVALATREGKTYTLVKSQAVAELGPKLRGPICTIKNIVRKKCIMT